MSSYDDGTMSLLMITQQVLSEHWVQSRINVVAGMAHNCVRDWLAREDLVIVLNSQSVNRPGETSRAGGYVTLHTFPPLDGGCNGCFPPFFGFSLLFGLCDRLSFPSLLAQYPLANEYLSYIIG